VRKLKEEPGLTVGSTAASDSPKGKEEKKDQRSGQLGSRRKKAECRGPRAPLRRTTEKTSRWRRERDREPLQKSYRFLDRGKSRSPNYGFFGRPIEEEAWERLR